jgi:hypothetical protein
VTPDLGAARPDFLDRALMIEFSGIKPELRRDEGEFWRDFAERRPLILGALLDAVSIGLRRVSEIRLEHPPRLADFALWASACEQALGVAPGEIMAACRTNSAETRDLALEASPLYGPLAQLAQEGFTGTVAELHARLLGMVGEQLRRSIRWPKTPNALGNALRRIVSNLHAMGIELQFSRNDVQGRRVVSVLHVAQGGNRRQSSSVVASQPDPF